jgi:hypothetical protein
MATSDHIHMAHDCGRTRVRHVDGVHAAMAAAAISTLLAILLAGCGQAAGGKSLAPSVVQVVFTSSIGYDAAVRTITDMGMRVALPCRNTVARADGATGEWVRWSAVDQRQDYSAEEPRLWVAPTPLAPTDWLDRLRGQSGVRDIVTSAGGSCPQHLADAAPTPAIPYYVAPSKIGTFARISFPLPQSSYETIVAEISGFGLRLADPCVEQTQASGSRATSSLRGQESVFAAQQALTIALTQDSSDLWQDQLRAALGRVHIEYPARVQC